MPAPVATTRFLPPLPVAAGWTSAHRSSHSTCRQPGAAVLLVVEGTLVPRLKLQPLLPTGMEGSAVLPAPTAIPRPLPAAGQQGSKDRLAGKRFGVYWDYFQDAEPEVVRICRQAVDIIRDNGGQVTFSVLASIHAVTWRLVSACA